MDALLALDTSTDAAAVALRCAHGSTCWNGEGGAQASTLLLARVQTLLDRHGIAPEDLQAVAFGCGPGAFTGLRVACAVAQGLALGARAAVLPIDSLLIVADDARAQHGDPPVFDVGVAMDARMGELYAARYRWHGGVWVVVAPPALARPAQLPAHWLGWPAVVAGSGLGLLQIPAALTALPQARDRAAALLRLAQAAWRRGDGLDAALALPTYLRDKVALTTAERVDARPVAAAGAPDTPGVGAA